MVNERLCSCRAVVVLDALVLENGGSLLASNQLVGCCAFCHASGTSAAKAGPGAPIARVPDANTVRKMSILVTEGMEGKGCSHIADHQTCQICLQ